MGEQDGRSSKSILKVMMQLNVVIVVPCAIGMSICSPWIMRMYGSGYRGAWSTLIVVVWTAAVMAILNPVGDVIAASGRMWLGLLMNAGWAVIFISAALLLVHEGSLGLASSRLIAYVVHAIWATAFAYRVISKHVGITTPEQGPKPEPVSAI
jgi:O-antigen/teichoic acid export membrane protein